MLRWGARVTAVKGEPALIVCPCVLGAALAGTGLCRAARPHCCLPIPWARPGSSLHHGEPQALRL